MPKENVRNVREQQCAKVIDEYTTILQCDHMKMEENIKGLKCDEREANEAGEAGEVVKKNMHLPDPDLRIEGVQCDHVLMPNSTEVIQCDTDEVNEAGEAGEVVQKKIHLPDCTCVS